MATTIKTNKVPRALLDADEVPRAIWDSQFDYHGPQDTYADGPAFFRYKNTWYGLDQFTAYPNDPYWHGSLADSWSSGVVVRLVDRYDGPGVIAGTWFC